jgi:tripartite-type tricarboxylate transporter receptor subunit TctC
MNIGRRYILASGVASLAGVVPRLAQAQPFPERAVRVIVPFATGGPNDIAARIIAHGLTERLGKQFLVENHPGAGGNVGTGQAAKARPDGYTVLFVAPSYVANPTLFDSVPYDPLTSFDAVTLAATAATVLTVNPAVAAGSVNDLIAAIRANPGKYSYASPGTGTPPHLLGELFRVTHRLDLAHVPFASGGQAILATVGGHAPISFGAVPPAVAFVKDGRLKALAVTSRQRSMALPGVPTIAEAGYPDLAADIWTAVLVPAGTSREITLLLQQEIAAVLALPEVKQRMAASGYVPVGSTPDECTAHLAAEYAKWGKVIREAGLKA